MSYKRGLDGAADGSNPIEIFGKDSCAEANLDAGPTWSPDGTQVAYHAPGCEGWSVESADGTGTTQPIDELTWRSWYASGLVEKDPARIGQVNH